MKARVKATGEIVEVAYLSEDKYGNKYYNVTTDTRTYRETELEMMSYKGYYFYTYDYWERLKHQYAGMAMNALLLTNNIRNGDLEGMRECNTNAIVIAFTLAERLKNE